MQCTFREVAFRWFKRVLNWPRFGHYINMWKSLIGARSTVAAATTVTYLGFNNLTTNLDEDAPKPQYVKHKKIAQQPAFVSLSSSQKPGNNKQDSISLNELVLISGSSHVDLSKEISGLIGVPVASADLKRFAGLFFLTVLFFCQYALASLILLTFPSSSNYNFCQSDCLCIYLSDGEVSIQIYDNLRGKDVFIVQSCTAPVNDSIMELLLTVSTARYKRSLHKRLHPF